MTTPHKPRLFHKLVLLTGSLGIVFIALFWLVMLVAEDRMEIISLHHWLDSEANLYVQEYHIHQDRRHLPNHYEFDFYWSGAEMPEWLRRYQTPGFYEHHLGPEDKHFLVRPDPSGEGLFYVVFKDDADDYLDAYEDTLHKVTFSIGVAITLLMFFYGYYLVRQIALPLQRVTGKIKQMTPDSPPFQADAQYDELYSIESALLDSKKKIDSYFRREQEFSRFAAHEIRTPLMVLQGSAELLERIGQTSSHGAKAVQRIRQASDDIRVLTDAFLLLGKETIDAHHFTDSDLAILLQQQMRVMTGMFSLAPEHYQLNISASPTVQAPESFLIIIINNLLKNAFSYASDTVLITLDQHQLTVSNPYQPSQQESRGFGYGLVIIARICDRLNWPYHALHDADRFTVEITFAPSKTA